MTDIDIEALRKLAENATPGPWFAEGLDDEPAIAHSFDVDGYPPGYADFVFPDKAADAEFIAAFDPPTVIALLDELERLQSAQPSRDEVAVATCLALGHGSGGGECAVDYEVADAVLALRPVPVRENPAESTNGEES
ncbi:ead/Ea22-like family protein [Agromyces atrinae]|uniref:ead/Ea22-like family protein n=1 Tax=Agromyces atrinae TaxID=592376 RepID=UPI001F56AF9B|nr:ead/Ea22-like family protein [Agromyces atrinae]MCI2959535.1 ead/Ea22-like family protein [Agromyces atrinae]